MRIQAALQDARALRTPTGDIESVLRRFRARELASVSAVSDVSDLHVSDLRAVAPSNSHPSTATTAQHTQAAMLSRKIALAALLGAALAVPAMAINSALVSAVKLANQSPWDRDVEETCFDKNAIRGLRDAVARLTVCTTESLMDDLSESDEVCVTDGAWFVEAYTPKTAVQRGDKIYGHCLAQAVMDIIDDDGDNTASVEEMHEILAILNPLWATVLASL